MLFPKSKILLWKFDTEGQIYSSPTVAEDIVYVGIMGTNDVGYVYALDADDGSEIWKYETGDWVGSSPTIADGIVYVGSIDAYIYALDVDDGSEVWKFKTKGQVMELFIDDPVVEIPTSPTADKPIVGIKKAGLNLPATEKELLEIGYYNGGTQTVELATVLIDECKSTTTGETSSYATVGEYPVAAVASSRDISPSSATEFKVAFKNNNLVSGEKYICKLKIVQEGDPTIEYETMTFFLNVIS